MCQVVSDTAFAFALEHPVDGQSDLVHYPTTDSQGSQASCHHRPRLDLSTRRANHHPVSMLDLTFRRQLWTEFGKHLRLQRIQPWHPASHGTTYMVLGQPISGDY